MKILVISYSQTGQLNEIIDNCLSPIQNSDIDRIKYAPKEDFKFPWTSESFFDAMPESVLQEKVELKPITYKHSKYDLIKLAQLLIRPYSFYSFKCQTVFKNPFFFA